jgi:hypothetical protein
MGLVRSLLTVLRAGLRLIRVKRHERSGLIRWKFLPDFACGF